MQKTIDVLVIGTEPPCPRCDLMSRLVAETAGSLTNVRLRHCSFDSLEATELGRRMQRKIGTAKHVAKATGIKVDWDSVYQSVSRKETSGEIHYRAADKWTPELDKLLEPCQKAAETIGYLMTPILIINGQVKHHGSVPARQQIAKWLSE